MQFKPVPLIFAPAALNDPVYFLASFFDNRTEKISCSSLDGTEALSRPSRSNV